MINITVGVATGFLHRVQTPDSESAGKCDLHDIRRDEKLHTTASGLVIRYAALALKAMAATLSGTYFFFF